MNLSEAELRIIARIRKGQRAWRWGRWSVLITSFACTVTFAYALFQLYDRFQKRRDDMLSIANLACYSGVYFGICMMSWCMTVWTLCRWNGDHMTKLLLRLLEEHENPKS